MIRRGVGQVDEPFFYLKLSFGLNSCGQFGAVQTIRFQSI